MFIDTASFLRTHAGKNYYDWDNKITFNLTPELLDSIVYFIDFNINKGNSLLPLTSKDVLFNLQISDETCNFKFTLKNLTIESNLPLASLYGFSSMLKAAKIKMYGWT